MRIAIQSLTKRFGRVRALEALSLEIPPGQIVAILGANGAGKTTLLRCLSAIAAPDSGHISCDGEPFHRGRIDLRRRLAFLPEFPIIFPHLTVARHIAVVLGLYKDVAEQNASIVTQHLSELDMLTAIDTPMGNLSRGQIYKVALSTLLSVDPELWLLDEPFASGMDPLGISYFRRQARAAADRGHTILYSTQILDVVEKFSDRLCLIHKGKLRAFDSVANLRPGGDLGLEELFRQLREEKV